MANTIAAIAKELGVDSAEVLERAKALDPDIASTSQELDEDVIEYLNDAFKEIIKERRKKERDEKTAARKAEQEKKRKEVEAKKAAQKAKDAGDGEAEAQDAPAVVSAEASTVSEAPTAQAPARKSLKDSSEISIRDEVGPGLQIVKAAEPGAEVGQRKRRIDRYDPTKLPEKKTASAETQRRNEPAGGAAPLIRDSRVHFEVSHEEAQMPIIDLKGDMTGVRTFNMRKQVDDVVEAAEREREKETLRSGTRHGAGETTESQGSSLHSQQAGVRTWRRPGRAKSRMRQQGFQPNRQQKAKSEEEILAELAGTSVEVPMPTTVRELSQKLGIKSTTLMSTLIKNKIFVTVNDPLPSDTVELLGMDLNIEIKPQHQQDVEEEFLMAVAEDKEEDRVLRAPVVTVLGHVDHGKTTLMDTIRKANVAAGEAGGITQHIGAYKVNTPKGEVVFLDTPGHQAFSAMRARGANITDIVLLVIAADDGVMPQTEESIDHARAANVPIIVAINKIDKPNANVQRVKEQLTRFELIPEEWGGTTIMCEVSGLSGKGVDRLLEMLALQAEILELRANPKKLAMGTVLESELTVDRGVVVKALVQDGVLQQGDLILAGATFGKIKALFNDHGKRLKEASPSTPVEITGLSEMPRAGDKFYKIEDIQKARQIADERKAKLRAREILERRHTTLENLFVRLEEGNLKEVRVVIKADVGGSLEVLKKSLSELSTAEVKVRILHSGVGGITESDVVLADASDAVILGFHVVPEATARTRAEEVGVEIKTYQIIYEMINELKSAMEGMLEPESVEKILGHAEVRQVFRSSKLGNIAGCFVTDGLLRRDAPVRLVRENIIIYPQEDREHRGARLQSLKRFKDDVREVKFGFECGLRIDGFDDVREGDVIEAFEMEQVKRTLAK